MIEPYCEYQIADDDCGEQSIGHVEARLPGSSIGWKPFSYCENHHTALIDDLTAAGFQVREP